VGIDEVERGPTASGGEPRSLGERDDDAYYAVPVSVNRRMGELALGAMSGIVALVYAFGPPHERYPLWLTVPVFLILCLDLLARGIDERPRLTMDADGIVDRSSVVWGPLRIQWADVLSVMLPRMPGTVRLELRDPRAFRARVGIRRRIEMWIMRLFGYRGVTISTSLLEVNREQLKERIDRGLQRFERSQLGLSGDRARLPPDR
jgi:hypothetical protein